MCNCKSKEVVVNYESEYTPSKHKKDSGYDVRGAEESFEIEPMGIKYGRFREYTL